MILYKYFFFSRKQEINREAIHMRDATKIISVRQEHSAQTTTKARTKMAIDFRQQVEDHKIELERLERKLLTTSNQTCRLFISITHKHGHIKKFKRYLVFACFYFSQNCYATRQHRIFERRPIIR